MIKRKCIGCLEQKDREKMLKITKNYLNNKVYINPNSKIFGRSVYLCYNNNCINNAFKKNKIEKILKTSLSEDIKQQIIKIGTQQT